MTSWYGYPYIALTGGADGALDSLDGSLLKDGDFAIVVNGTGAYSYKIDATSAAAESSPYVISPDSNAGDKRWVLVASLASYDLLQTGTATRTVNAKLSDLPTAADFGTVGNGTTSDSAAIQALVDYIKATEGLGGDLQVIRLAPKRYYMIDTTINLTGLRSEGLVIDGGRATLVGKCTGKPVIDMLDSQRITIKDLLISGDATLTPSDAIIMGRGITGQDAAYNYFSNVFVYGHFTTACVYNVGSEITKWDKVHLQNSKKDGLCFYADADNERHITSDFFTVDIAEDTYQSLNDNKFSNCAFEQIYVDTDPGGPAVKISGTTQGWRFDTCYAQAQKSPAFKIRGDQRSLHIDCHCETTNLTNNVLIDVDAAAAVIDDFKLTEYYAFATDSIIDTSSNNFAATIRAANVKVSQSYNNNCVIFGNNGTLNYYGDVSCSNVASFNNLSGAVSWTGRLNSNINTNNLTLPAAFSLEVFSTINGLQFLPSLEYTPAVTVSVGNITSYNSSGWYRRIGSTMVFTAQADIVNNGNGSGVLYISLPSAGRNNTVCAGRVVTTGKMAQGIVAGNKLGITVYDNNYAGGNNTTVIFSGVYEVG